MNNPAYGLAGSYDIRGISIQKIGNVTEVITNYIENVNKTTSQITADAGSVPYVSGIKGEEQKAQLESYIKDAVEKIHTVTNELKKFNEALIQVQSNYLGQSQTVASNMGTVTQADVNAKTGVEGFSD